VQRSTKRIQPNHHLPHVFVVIKIRCDEKISVGSTSRFQKLQKFANVADLLKHLVTLGNRAYAGTHPIGRLAQNHPVFELRLQLRLVRGGHRQAR
jgi:hypothetical protein